MSVTKYNHAGANVTIVARTAEALEETLQELKAHTKTPEQKLHAKALDLVDAEAVCNRIVPGVS